MQGVNNGGDVLVFTYLHQDLGSTVLNILEPLKALFRDPDAECITILQPGGDKGMDEHLSSRMVERLPELSNMTVVKEGSLANVLDVIVKAKIGVKPDSQISHRRREGKDVVEKGDGGNEKQSWWGVPMGMALVLELLSCKKFSLMHAGGGT